MRRLRASLSDFPGLNAAAAGTDRVSRGLRVVRADLLLVENVPKPRRLTASLRARDPAIQQGVDLGSRPAQSGFASHMPDKLRFVHSARSPWRLPHSGPVSALPCSGAFLRYSASGKSGGPELSRSRPEHVTWSLTSRPWGHRPEAAGNPCKGIMHYRRAPLRRTGSGMTIDPGRPRERESPAHTGARRGLGLVARDVGYWRRVAKAPATSPLVKWARKSP